MTHRTITLLGGNITLNFTGRIVTVSLLIFIFGGHVTYFMGKDAHVQRIIGAIQQYDFIWLPILLPFLLWLGKKYDTAKYFSEKDDLTGAYNRRYLTHIFPTLANKSFTIFIVNVNEFKTINDTYGYDIGDVVLQHITFMISQMINKQDRIIRMGGEKFLVLSESGY